MREPPIIFSGEMVRAILDGRKTQTRRSMKPQPEPANYSSPYYQGLYLWKGIICASGDNPGPLGPVCVGDHLWVRETWAECKTEGGYLYKATGDGTCCGPWRSSIYMPRRAIRITLEVTRVWVERLQDISIKGVYAKRGPEWDANPWVWAYEFRRIKP